MFRRVRSDIAYGARTAPHADTERLGKAAQRSLRESERLQPFVSKPDIDRESRSMLFAAGIDVLEHATQPCARFCPVGELQENVPPVPHENRRDDVILDIVQIGRQVSRGQSRLRT